MVALPTKMGSTPVAIGSSVPAWPTLRVPSRRRSFATISKEVKSSGLSMMIIPSKFLPHSSLVSCQLLLHRAQHPAVHLLQRQLLDVAAGGAPVPSAV